MERAKSIGVVGLGLMGSSLALKLKEIGYTSQVYGYDRSVEVVQQALDLQIIDNACELNELLEKATLIIMAIPVDAIKMQLPAILDLLDKGQVVMDLGSTKHGIAQKVKNHKNRKSYVACHPIAGTENNGPVAAFSSLFQDKVNIICDREQSSDTALVQVLEVISLAGMRPKYMSSKEHDRHIAFVSHLSHISSFTLGQTVLEVEADEENIFDMAGSGFASTVRLAKSSPDMWAPIFVENSDNILEVLDAYIKNLKNYKSMIKKADSMQLNQTMKKTNRIRKVLESNT